MTEGDGLMRSDMKLLACLVTLMLVMGAAPTSRPATTTASGFETAETILSRCPNDLLPKPGEKWTADNDHAVQAWIDKEIVGKTFRFRAVNVHNDFIGTDYRVTITWPSFKIGDAEVTTHDSVAIFHAPPTADDRALSRIKPGQVNTFGGRVSRFAVTSLAGGRPLISVEITDCRLIK